MDLICEDGNRNAAGLRITRHERVECLEMHLHRKVRIRKDDATQRVGCGECRMAEARQIMAWSGAAVASFVFGRFQGTLQDPADRAGFAGLCKEREERTNVAAGRNEALGGPVHDFPVAQVTAPAERYGSRPNASQGHRKASEMILIVVAERRSAFILRCAQHTVAQLGCRLGFRQGHSRTRIESRNGSGTETDGLDKIPAVDAATTFGIAASARRPWRMMPSVFAHDDTPRGNVGPGYPQNRSEATNSHSPQGRRDPEVSTWMPRTIKRSRGTELAATGPIDSLFRFLDY